MLSAAHKVTRDRRTFPLLNAGSRLHVLATRLFQTQQEVEPKQHPKMRQLFCPCGGSMAGTQIRCGRFDSSCSEETPDDASTCNDT